MGKRLKVFETRIHGGIGTIPEDWQTFAEKCGEN